MTNMQMNMRTSIGKTIIEILNETASIQHLVDFFEQNDIFKESLWKGAYRIDSYEWEKITGIPIENSDFLPDAKDGQIFVKRYESDSDNRFVYIYSGAYEDNE